MLNSRTVGATCPKTLEYTTLEVEFPDQRRSSHDIISKDNLECGADCDVPCCPIVKHYNAIYL